MSRKVTALVRPNTERSCFIRNVFGNNNDNVFQTRPYKTACEYNPNFIQNFAITPVSTLYVGALFQRQGRVIG